MDLRVEVTDERSVGPHISVCLLYSKGKSST
jgi:hypothetical protein